MPYAQINGLKTHYEITGEGPPVVLVAGLGGEGAYWSHLRDRLSADHRVLIHDQRGAGRSDWPEGDYSVDLFADDLAALLEQTGMRGGCLIGHSTGGAIGLSLAARHPGAVSSMVLHSSWAKSDSHFHWCFETRLALLRATTVGDYLFGSSIFMYPPEFIRDNHARLREGYAAAGRRFPPAGVVERRIKAICDFDGLSYLPRIDIPVLVHCAADDILTPLYHSRLMASEIAGAELKVPPSGGHGYAEVHPETFCDTVREFLSRPDVVAAAGIHGRMEIPAK